MPACDRRTDGIAVASTALAMQALRRAVKILVLESGKVTVGHVTLKITEWVIGRKQTIS